MSVRRFNVFFLASLLPLASGAAELRFAQALECALARDPELPALRAAAADPRAARGAARILRDPELRAGYASGSQEKMLDLKDLEDLPPGSPDTRTEDNSGYSVGLRFFPPDPRILSAKTAEADAQIAAAEADVRAGILEAQFGLLDEWIVFRQYAEEKALCEEGVAAARRLEERVNKAVQNQIMTSADAMDARIRRMTAEQELARARRALRQAGLALLERTGIAGAPEQLVVRDGPDLASFAPRDGMLEQLLKISDQRRPEIARAEADAAAAGAVCREVRAERQPWFEHVQAAYTDRDDYRIASDTEWSFQVAVRVPLLSWANGDLKAARSASETAKGTALAARARVRKDVELAWQAVLETDRARKETASASAEIDAGIDELPPTTAYRLEDARIGARRSALRTQADFETAVARLMAAVGTIALPK